MSIQQIQKINVTENLERDRQTVIFFVLEEVKETILDFSHKSIRILWIYFVLIRSQYKMTQYNSINEKLPHSQHN